MTTQPNQVEQEEELVLRVHDHMVLEAVKAVNWVSRELSSAIEKKHPELARDFKLLFEGLHMKISEIDPPMHLARQATASSLAAENARFRKALRKIAAGTKITLENGDEWPSPLGARHSQDIARAALQGE